MHYRHKLAFDSKAQLERVYRIFAKKGLDVCVSPFGFDTKKEMATISPLDQDIQDEISHLEGYRANSSEFNCEINDAISPLWRSRENQPKFVEPEGTKDWYPEPGYGPSW